MANEGFDKIVAEENGPELVKFAYHVLLYFFESSRTIAEDKKRQKRMAMWLRNEYPEYMVDPNAPLTVAKFNLNKKIHIPAKDKIMKIIGAVKININSKEEKVRIPSRLCNARWLDTEGNELPDDYYIEEKTLCLSVECDGGNNTQVIFSVYRQLTDDKFETIAENLRGEVKNDTNTYIAQWQYKRERERRRERNVKLYFRAHKNNTVETESAVRSFVDGIVAIETERNNQGKFFDFDIITNYGGFQEWYEDKKLFTAVAEWKEKKGKVMNSSGCGPIAATNVIYYYAQQFNASFAKLKTPNGFQDTPKKPKQEEYMRMAFSVYNNYTLQTIQGLGLGIWYIDPLCDGIVKFAQERGISLEKHTLTNKVLASNNSFRQAADFITEGLKNNYPVILLVTLNGYIAEIERKTQPDPDMAELHFVTITAMKRAENDEEDYELIVSSWGNSKIIKSLKRMWKETHVLFNGAQVATAAAVATCALKKKDEETPDWLNGLQTAATVVTDIAPLTLSFASVSLGYCSFS
jgi:hypothetical protein